MDKQQNIQSGHYTQPENLLCPAVYRGILISAVPRHTTSTLGTEKHYNTCYKNSILEEKTHNLRPAVLKCDVYYTGMQKGVRQVIITVLECREDGVPRAYRG